MIKIRVDPGWMLVIQSKIHARGGYERLLHKFQVMTEPYKFGEDDLKEFYEPYEGNLFFCRVLEISESKNKGSNP